MVGDRPADPVSPTTPAERPLAEAGRFPEPHLPLLERAWRLAADLAARFTRGEPRRNPSLCHRERRRLPHQLAHDPVLVVAGDLLARARGGRQPDVLVVAPLREVGKDRLRRESRNLERVLARSAEPVPAEAALALCRGALLAEFAEAKRPVVPCPDRRDVLASLMAVPEPDELAAVNVPGGLVELPAVGGDLPAGLADPSAASDDGPARAVAEDLRQLAFGELALLGCLWHRITSIDSGCSTVPRDRPLGRLLRRRRAGSLSRS
jgi:hypothetical protein